MAPSSGSQGIAALAPSQGNVALRSQGIVITTYNIGAAHIGYKIKGDGTLDPKFKAKLASDFEQMMEA